MNESQIVNHPNIFFTQKITTIYVKCYEFPHFTV